jgi:hypothetical protein
MECYHPNPFKHGWKAIGIGIAGLFTAVIFGLLFGYFVQWLWNWLMPTIFGLTKITYWQAFGLVILARLIFGSFGHNGDRHYPHKYHQHWGHHHHDCDSDHGRGWEYHGNWKNKGDWENRSYYDEWWKTEGKALFENYIDRIKQPEDQTEHE